MIARGRSGGRRARRRSAIADPRVDPHVEQVDGEVHRRDDRARDEHDRLDDREVASGDRLYARRPMPGHAKTVSTTTAVVTRIANDTPAKVTTGISAFRSAWRQITARSEAPFARAVRT